MNENDFSSAILLLALSTSHYSHHTLSPSLSFSLGNGASVRMHVRRKRVDYDRSFGPISEIHRGYKLGERARLVRLQFEYLKEERRGEVISERIEARRRDK